jgi:hypothetical protein
MQSRTWRLIVVIAAMTLIAAACGDDDDGGLLDAATSTTESQADQEAPDDDESSTDEPGTTAASDDDPAPVSTGSGEIDELLQRFQDSPLRVTYLMGEAPNQSVVTLSQDPNRDPPVSALIIEDEGGKVITIGDTVISCGGGQCFEVPGGAGADLTAGLLSPLIMGFLLTEDITGSPGFDVDRDSETIAGRSGICFRFTPRGFVTDADVEFIRQCIDAELGFTLLVEGLEEGSDQVEQFMVLTEFGQPRPEDFEPDGEVLEIPDA